MLGKNIPTPCCGAAGVVTLTVGAAVSFTKATMLKCGTKTVAVLLSVIFQQGIPLFDAIEGAKPELQAVTLTLEVVSLNFSKYHICKVPPNEMLSLRLTPGI